MVDGWERDENVALFPFPARGTIPPPSPHFRHVRKSPSYFVSNDLNYGRSKKEGGEWGLCLFAGWHLPLASLSLPLAGITEEEGGGRMTNKCCHISPLPSSHQLSRNGFPPPPPSKSLNFLFPGEGIAWSRSRNRTLFVVDSLDRERLISLPFLPHVSSKLNS